jgi:hypothetical protein
VQHGSPFALQQNCGGEHPPSGELPLEDPPLDEPLLDEPPLDELLLEEPPLEELLLDELLLEELLPCKLPLEDPLPEELPEAPPAGEPEEPPPEELLVEASLWFWSEDASPPDAMTPPPHATANAPPARTISRSRRSQCAMILAPSTARAAGFRPFHSLNACRSVPSQERLVALLRRRAILSRPCRSVSTC